MITGRKGVEDAQLAYNGEADAVREGPVTRWFAYRHGRNDTARDYGVAFAEETLVLLPAFLADAIALELILRENFHDLSA